MELKQHPLLTSNISGLYLLPVQAIPTKKKLEGKKATNPEGNVSTWEKQCIDALEYQGWMQYTQNYKYLINKKIVNGEFIANDYFNIDGCDDFVEPLEQLIKDGKIPKFIKNFNIVSIVINSLVNIFDQYPDTFHIVGYGEAFQSSKDAEQTRLLRNWFYERLEEEINKQIEAPQIQDPNNPTQEEQQAYQQYEQAKEQLRKASTPEEIGQYMKSFRHDYELWAEYKAIDYKFRYDIPKLKRNEFRDFIENGIRARHYKVLNGMLTLKSVNINNLFYDKASDVEYIQDGDYAGEIYTTSAQRIIDMFAAYLTADQVKRINQTYALYNDEDENLPQTTDIFGNPINYLPINGVPYNTRKPYRDKELNRLAPNLGMNYTPPPVIDKETMTASFDPFNLSNMDHTSIYSNQFVVTECYWKSQDPVYTLNWINPETKIQEIIEVDDNFIFPSYIKKITNQSLVGEIKFNTAILSYKPTLYRGIKIRMPNTESIYLQTGPTEYQKTSMKEIVPKIPIFGQLSKNNGVEAKGIVDELKPYIFLHNIAMNKATKLQERGFLPFIAMDMKILPRHKDWGDEDKALAKWIGIGEDLGVAPVDTSTTNTMGDPSGGGQFPRIVDIDLTPRVIQQLEIAKSIVSVAYNQIGVSPQLLGQPDLKDSATGINGQVVQSQNSIMHWVTTFNECEREMLKYSLDIAQWLESNNEDISVEYTNSDYTTGILKMANTNFNLFDWRIYIVNSQEELRRRKAFESLAGMNTLPLKTSDRMELLNASTPTERIVKLIKASEDKAEKQQQQQLELEQQRIASMNENEAKKIAAELERLKLKLDSEERQAWIQSRGYLGEGEQDIDKSTIPDAFEYEKFQAQSSRDLDKLGLNRDKLQVEKDKEYQRQIEEDRRLQLEQQKLELKRQQIQQTAKNVKILDKGKYAK